MVRAHHDPVDSARGFWEVTTCAVVDWPCQTRVVELVDHGEYLSIVTTIVDHDTPVMAASLETSDDLAALHRELAANVPWDISAMASTASDRNTELRVIPPFPLKRLPGSVFAYIVSRSYNYLISRHLLQVAHDCESFFSCQNSKNRY